MDAKHLSLVGCYGGVVEDNRDPQKLGRLKVRVPHVYGAVGGVFGAVATNDLPWALPVGLPNGMSQSSGGADWTPDVGDQVLVQFLDGEPEKPVWSWFMQSIPAVENFPLHAYTEGKDGSVGNPKRGAWVRYGHTLEWNADGLIMTTAHGYRMLLTDATDVGNNGNINISTQGGHYLDLDDTTEDATLNVTNNWNINVGAQVLALSDSFSLTTLSNEIELNSGSHLSIDTVTDLTATVGRKWSVEASDAVIFDFKADWSATAAKGISFQTDQDLDFSASGNMGVDVKGSASVTSLGEMALKTSTGMTLDFTSLSLGGASANSPYVLGDQLLSYLNALYGILVSHTHSGVQTGSGTTAVMLPSPPVPSVSLLSSVIKGR